MPRITKPWMNVLDTDDDPSSELGTVGKDTLFAVAVCLSFVAGAVCAGLASFSTWLLVAGFVGTGCCVTLVPTFHKLSGIDRHDSMSAVKIHPTLLIDHVPSMSTATLQAQTEVQQSSGAITPPNVPIRSVSALSLKAFAFASASRGIERRDSGYVSQDDTEDTVPKQSQRALPEQSQRTLDEAAQLYKSGKGSQLTNAEIIELCIKGTIPAHSLEKLLDNDSRAIYIRRNVLVQTIESSTPRTSALKLALDLPFEDYDFSRVRGRCAENVIGYMPLPLGVAGPLRIDGSPTYLPMATTEGTLIASTSRGCKALNAAGGVATVILADGMTRAPVVRFRNISEAVKAKSFLESETGFQSLRDAFQSTTNHGNLLSVTVKMAGSYLYLRFKASTGEAMGMNIVGKGVHAALQSLLSSRSSIFQNMEVMSLSGNYCSDKKPSAINWIEGRGKSVVAEAVIPKEVVTSIFRCSVDSLVALNTSKNYVGSALAGVSAGGFNAHAANIVTALFLATGQDPAQNVESSNCITMMEKNAEGALQVSVSMPSLEVGTIGGGTELAPQASMLNLLGVKDNGKNGNGENAGQFARVIAAAVLAGELSLCAALATGDLIKAHMAFNRKPAATAEA